MRKSLCLAVSLLLFCGCRQADVIPRGEMESMLYDMYLVDAYLEYDQDIRASVDSMLVYLPVIRKHGYDRDAFEKSLRYYIGHNDDIVVMMKNVKKRMEDRLAEIESEIAAGNAEGNAAADGSERKQVDSAGKAPGKMRNADRPVHKNPKERKIIEGKEKEEGGEV